MRIVLVSIPIRVAPCSSPAGVEMRDPRNIWARVSPPGVNGRKGKTVAREGRKATETFPKNSFTGGAIPKNDCCRGEEREGGVRAVKERAGRNRPACQDY